MQNHNTLEALSDGIVYVKHLHPFKCLKEKQCVASIMACISWLKDYNEKFRECK